MRVSVVEGDITQQKVDAIVNAANNRLEGGGGVDGAIHRAAGPALEEECRHIRLERGGCPTGEAVITGGHRLSARYVIHTVGPVWHGGSRGERQLLFNCYANSLRLAEEHQLKTIAFPAISCGAYGYPIELAAKDSLDAIFAHKAVSVEEVRLVLFSPREFVVFRREYEKRI